MARSNVVINLVGQRRETINYSYDDVHNKAARMIAEVPDRVSFVVAVVL